MYVRVSLKIELDATASLDQMEQRIQEAGREAMKEAFKQAIRLHEEEQKGCPDCASQDSRSQGTCRRVLLTTFGRVEAPLRRQRCSSCGRHFRPAESCLSVLKGHNITQRVRQVAALVGSSWPYETAAGVLHQLCGTSLSDERLRQITNEEGTARALLELEQAKVRVVPSMHHIRAERDEEQRRKGRKQKAAQLDWLQVGLDGGWIPAREQAGGMEGKIAVVACAMENVGKRGRHRLRARKYVATFAGSEQIGTLAYAAACELGATDANKQVVLGDGAQWIKTQAEEQFPNAQKVLDWAHVWRKIHDAIRAVQSGSAWVAQTPVRSAPTAFVARTSGRSPSPFADAVSIRCTRVDQTVRGGHQLCRNPARLD